MNMESDYDAMYKIVLVGDPGVGKTNMLSYFTAKGEEREGRSKDNAVLTFQKNRKPTVGVEFATAIVTHPNGAKIKAQIWDTAGQERYRAITSSHYRRAAGALLVYDVTDRQTFVNAKNTWFTELRETADEEGSLLACISLVGNKTDLQPPVISEAEHNASVSSLALNLSSRTSAKQGTNIQACFNDLVIHVYNTEKSKNTGGYSKKGGQKLKGSDQRGGAAGKEGRVRLLRAS